MYSFWKKVISLLRRTSHPILRYSKAILTRNILLMRWQQNFKRCLVVRNLRKLFSPIIVSNTIPSTPRQKNHHSVIIFTNSVEKVSFCRRMFQTTNNWVSSTKFLNSENNTMHNLIRYTETLWSFSQIGQASASKLAVNTYVLPHRRNL